MTLIMYIFALLGMELFANTALVDEYDNLIIGQDAITQVYRSGDYYTYPRDNFNNLLNAFTTVFIVILGEDWNWTMYQWVRAYGYGSNVSYNIAVIFFVVLLFMGNIVMLSIFTAILLRNFKDYMAEDEEQASIGNGE